LAKVANKLAKQHPAFKSQGICNLTTLPAAKVQGFLAETPPQDIWGIGSRWATKLEKMGIRSALDLSQVEPAWLRQHFNTEEPRYHPSATVRLLEPTHDTLILSKAALRGLERIYRAGYRYQKAGVMLLNLQPRSQRQLGLFDEPGSRPPPQRDQLLDIMDRINREMGRDTLWIAA